MTEAFFDALDELFTLSEHALFKDIYVFIREVVGIENSKVFEIRLAELGRYRGQGPSTYDVLTATYPSFIQKMARMSVSGTDVKKFTDDLDARMIGKGSLDITDPLFVSKVDTRMEQVFMEMDREEHSAMFSALSTILTEYFNEREPLLQAVKKAYANNVPIATYMLLLLKD